MKIILWSVMLLIAAVFVMGCDEDREEERAGDQVPVFREFTGQQGPFPDRGFFVVQDQQTWQALWGDRQAPAVDFANNTVLVALMGRQPTAGYDIDIVDVRATGTQIVAYVETSAPERGEEVAQVITYPYDMVVVPRLTQPVAYRVEGGADVIAIQRQFTGQQSQAVNPQTVVIRDAATWRTFWTNTFGPNVPLPEINFDQNMAAAVLIGRRPTAGYSVFITSANDMNNRVEVSYRVTSPAPGEPVAQVVTSPYAIAILPATAQAVAFRPVTTTAVATVP